MKANKTKHLIYELDQIAFDNRERGNKRLHDMHQLVDVELAELERLAEIGRATEKVFKSDGFIRADFLVDESDDESCSTAIIENEKQLLEWAKEVG